MLRKTLPEILTGFFLDFDPGNSFIYNYIN